MGVIECELPNICFPVLTGGSPLPPLHPLLGELWDPPLWTSPSPGLTKLFLVPLSHCVIKPRPPHLQPYRLRHHPFTVKLQCIETRQMPPPRKPFPSEREPVSPQFWVKGHFHGPYIVASFGKPFLASKQCPISHFSGSSVCIL